MTTINENKAVKMIGFSSLVNFLSLFMLMIGNEKKLITLYFIGLVSWMVSLFILFYGGYTLGWEYKRLSLDEDKLNDDLTRSHD